MRSYSKNILALLYTISVRYEKWCKTHLSETTRSISVCFITGILAGIAAWFLKFIIRHLSRLLTSGLTEESFNWILIIAPVLAIILSGWLQRRVFQRMVSRGTERLRTAISKKEYKLPWQVSYEPIIGCAITVGGGGSAGAEGPIAYAGGAIGSNTAKLFGMNSNSIRLMLGIGAAAGIAAIFKSPLGGVFFTLEVLGMTITTGAVLTLIGCCLISAFTAYMLSGFTPDIIWQGAVTEFDYRQFPWLLLIGIIVGLYCRWYTFSGLKARSVWLNIRHHGARNLFAGLFLGLIIFCFPTLYGEGYQSIHQVLGGELSHIADYSPFYGLHSQTVIPLMLSGILLLKGMAVYTTNNAGGVSGSFAPTLFAGCMAGALLAYGAGEIGCQIPATQITYMCMAAAMAGIVRAPLMATFITIESTMTYSLLFPVATVAFASYIVASRSLWSADKKPYNTHS